MSVPVPECQYGGHPLSVPIDRMSVRRSQEIVSSAVIDEARSPEVHSSPVIYVRRSMGIVSSSGMDTRRAHEIEFQRCNYRA